MYELKLEIISQQTADNLNFLYNKLPESPVNKKVLYKEVISFFNSLPKALNWINGRFSGKLISFLIKRINLPKWIKLLKEKQDDSIPVISKLILIFQTFSKESTTPVEKEIAFIIVNFIKQFKDELIIKELCQYLHKYWNSILPIINEIILPEIIPTDTIENKQNIKLINNIFDLAIASCQTTDEISRNKQKQSITDILEIINIKLIAAGFPKIISKILKTLSREILNSHSINDQDKARLLLNLQNIFNKAIHQKTLDRNFLMSENGKPRSEIVNTIKLTIRSIAPILRTIIKIEEHNLRQANTSKENAYHQLSIILKKINHSAKDISERDVKILTSLVNSDDDDDIKFSSKKLLKIISLITLISNLKSDNNNLLAQINKTIELPSLYRIKEFRQKLNISLNLDNQYANRLKQLYDLVLEEAAKLDDAYQCYQSNNPLAELDKILNHANKLKHFVNQLAAHIDSNAKEDNDDYRLFVDRDILPVFGDKTKKGARLWSINKEFGLDTAITSLQQQILNLEQNVLEHKKTNTEIGTQMSIIDQIKQEVDDHLKTLKQKVEQYKKEAEEYAYSLKSENTSHKTSKPTSLAVMILLRILLYPYYFIKKTIIGLSRKAQNYFNTTSPVFAPQEREPSTTEIESQDERKTEVPPVAISLPLIFPIKTASTYAESTDHSDGAKSDGTESKYDTESTASTASLKLIDCYESSETLAQPIAQPAAQPIAQPTAQPAAQPAAQQIVESTAIIQSTPVLRLAPGVTTRTYRIAFDIDLVKIKLQTINTSDISSFIKRLNTDNNNGAAAKILLKQPNLKQALIQAKHNAQILKNKYLQLKQKIKQLKSLEVSDSNRQLFHSTVVEILSELQSVIGFIKDTTSDTNKNEKFRLFVERILRDDLGFSNRHKGGARLSTINEDFDLIKDLQKIEQQILSVQKALPSMDTLTVPVSIRP